MAEAQLMEEELQQSAMQSDHNADQANDSVDGDVEMGDESVFASQSHIDVGLGSTDGDGDEDMDEDEGNQEEYDEEDAHGEDDTEHSDSGASGGDEDGDNFDEDAEGEDDDELDHDTHHPRHRSDSMIDAPDGEEDDEEDEDEGVGAVKIRPGETDDEDDSGEESASLASVSEAESEGEAEWDAADNDDAEDDELENIAGHCIFCKQDEEHDPGDDFEAFLACRKCGDNAHPHCAREQEALSSEDGSDSWACPRCADDSDSDVVGDLEVDMNGINDDDISPAARRSTAAKATRDLSSHTSPTNHDSHLSNHSIHDEDPMDGSRVLRKRKSSSVEADESIMALHKRLRNIDDDQSNDEAATTQESSSRPVSRSLRLKLTTTQPASIVKRTRNSILMRLRVNSSELRQILSRRPKGPKKRSHRGRRRASRSESTRAAPLPLSAIATPFTPSAYSQPFYSFYDKETDELKGKPYGGILNEAEADTSKTMPGTDDRRRFDEAKQKAEEEWRQRLLTMQAEVEAPTTKKSKKASGPASQIECIEFGGWEIDTWYAAPYPEEYSRNRVLYICEFCLKYMNSDYVAWRHKLKCPAKHPPGDEIYRHGSVSVFEVDGRKNPVYCQNLCLLAKLFLGSKTLYYDVEPFLFYVLCEYDDMGYHFVGYFSKEKRASSQNNVSCILTLPIHQRKGYGNLLIDFSYLLTRVEKKTGSPEKPLSDMGLVSYRNYWRLIMCRYLLRQFSEERSGKTGLSIKKISDDTGLTPDDVISALEGLRCLVRDPQTQLYAFRVDFQYCREYVAKWEAKKYVQLNERALTWTPYVMGRSNATNFELGPALNAIAPREEDEETKPVVPPEASLINGGDPTGQPDTPAEDAKTSLEAEVMKSTEPDEGTEMTDPAETTGANTDGLTNGAVESAGSLADAEDTKISPNPQSNPESAKSTERNWIDQYKDVPATRFEVVPPINGRRTDRTRSIIPRPPPVRTASSSVPRPKPRRPTSTRRSTASSSRPRTSTSSNKRKPGGTGRGPGRWPKGTKKSDYGNAASGPGLPPAWLAERARLAAVSTSNKKGGKEGIDVMDTVQVQSPGLRDGSKGLGSSIEKENADVEMQDAEGDVDA